MDTGVRQRNDLRGARANYAGEPGGRGANSNAHLLGAGSCKFPLSRGERGPARIGGGVHPHIRELGRQPNLEDIVANRVLPMDVEVAKVGRHGDVVGRVNNAWRAGRIFGGVVSKHAHSTVGRRGIDTMIEKIDRVGGAAALTAKAGDDLGVATTPTAGGEEPRGGSSNHDVANLHRRGVGDVPTRRTGAPRQLGHLVQAV